MAIVKIDSFGWLTSAPNTWVYFRWNASNLVGGTLQMGSPGRRPGSSYLFGRNFGQIVTARDEYIVHFAHRPPNSANESICTFCDGTTNQVILRFDGATTSRYSIHQGSVGNLIAGPSAAIATNTWHHIILRAKISNTVGEVELRIDGATEISASGLDTQASSNAYVDQIYFSATASGSGGGIHDIVICDTTGSAPYNGIIGDLAVYCVLPNGAGAVTGWTPSAGSNFQNVDDTLPDSDSTYNSTSTPAATDRYAIPTPTLTGSCRGVSVAALVRKDDAGVRTARLKLYDGTALQSGPTGNLADSYVYVENIWQVNPTTGLAWTAAELAAAEPGIELVS